MNIGSAAMANTKQHHASTMRRARDAANKAGQKWIAKLLPPDARTRLMHAAQIRNPQERAEAIDAALSHVQLHYPQFFTQEQ